MIYMAKIISTDEFENEVLNSSVPVIVDFYADWCMPCRMIAPSIDELSTELDGRAKVVKVNIDVSAGLASKYNVRGVPTIMFFKNGQAADTVVGAVPKEVLMDKLLSIL